MFLSFKYFNCQFHRKFYLRGWRGGGADPWLKVIFWERFRRIMRPHKEPAVPERLGNTLGEQKLGVFSQSVLSHIYCMTEHKKFWLARNSETHQAVENYSSII